ncbi:hypothetical protein CHS0354_038086 [Potamilus streckersoni]|uniref:Uncharacterized protein n=1 Tax=Potamilus streckersoni TaxID=2493646 RepID=A0AAE0SRZ1_9BIVA|nr:hypothetical protein CHS0354_038086 [Potamilus streckersoni]
MQKGQNIKNGKIQAITFKRKGKTSTTAKTHPQCIAPQLTGSGSSCLTRIFNTVRQWFSQQLHQFSDNTVQTYHVQDGQNQKLYSCNTAKHRQLKQIGQTPTNSLRSPSNDGCPNS